MACKTCKGCVERRVEDYRSYLTEGLEHWHREGHSTVFLTVTETDRSHDVAASSKALALYLNDVRRLYVKAGGPLTRPPYAFVPELHPQGHGWHWHGLIADFAAPWDSDAKGLFGSHVRRSFDRVELVSGHSGVAVAKQRFYEVGAKHGFGGGFVGLKQVWPSSGGVAGYVTKMAGYLSKSLAEGGLPKGASPVRSTKGAMAWIPGVGLTGHREQRLAAWRERSRGQGQSSAGVATATLDAVQDPRAHNSPRLPFHAPSFEGMTMPSVTAIGEGG